MLGTMFPHTATVRQQVTAADNLHGIDLTYTDLYVDVPGKFEDLNQDQITALMQSQINARHRFFCILPGPIEENRSALVYEGILYRVTSKQRRRHTMGSIPSFDVLLLQRWDVT